jgi:hypothetical protein
MEIETKKNTVLGKTFNSEEDRRNYFREELRKKLPELKQMEGFPIGEDEDILNLSDPPFYTACPNPWLNDFIAEWEEEKKQLEKEGKRDADFEVDKPYAADVSEGKNNPIYMAHSYHTKVPHPAIMRYILHYTQPGDVVYDGFAGTGMTGVASQYCSMPDTETKFKIESDYKENNLKLVWGRRKTILGDLSPIGTFIAYNYNTKIASKEFKQVCDHISESLIDKYSWMYETRHANGQLGKINHTIWSEVFECNSCSEEIEFWDSAVNLEDARMNDELLCKNCGASNSKKTSNKVWEMYFDRSKEETFKRTKMVPAYIVYTYNGKRYEKIPDAFDFDLLEKIQEEKKLDWFPTNKLPVGYNTSQPIKSNGITHVHHFYTDRNLIVLSALYNRLDLHEKLFFTSLSSRSSKRVKPFMSNFFGKLKGKSGGGWAGTPLNGTLYIPSLSTEVSVLESLKSRVNTLAKVHLLKEKFVESSSTLLEVSSATESSLEENSVDYIFTDPPFGSNIMYSEISFDWESWLKVKTNNLKEAIENKYQNKSTLDYQNLMSICFKEYFRILKPGKWMTVEFSNTSAAVWNGIQTAIQTAGFVIANLAAIDKKQGSFKAVTTVTAVKQDLVISCYKPSSEFDQKFKQHQNTDVAVWDFVEEHLNHLPIHLVKDNATTAIIERSPKILFDRLIAFYVQKGLPVPIDAGAFQKGLRERFIERDGMFFTNEQVQEYDRKKAENPEFIQLSILISSEQDGVLWLKNLLSDKSLAYQDIQPLWMQALAGARKGDVIPELAAILDDNFLKDDVGKWFVPNPEKEADLEKLRTKRLLKQFETYKAEAFKPKGKIKEVRVEALRAGFKEAYQEKDFKTIVQIGDRIPNNLLMEDEVLLQFYDIAVSRV